LKIEIQNFKPEYPAEVDFRASSKIEIENLKKRNIELEFNFEQFEDRNAKFSKREFLAGV
jgi:hypothetical protein